MPHATSFRVVNAESDFLSGLIVDKFSDVLSFQISSLGMEQRKADVIDVLKAVFKPRAIVERNDIGSRKFEGLSEIQGVVHGTLEGPVTINLNGVKLEVDLLGGEAMRLVGAADDNAFADFLINEAGVAVVPGSAFGAPGPFRRSFAASSDTLKDALGRMQRALSGAKAQMRA